MSIFLLNKKVNKYKKAIPFLAYFKLGNSFEDEFYIKKAVNVICLQRTQVHKFSKRWMECFLIKRHPKCKYQLVQANPISEAKLFRLKKHRKKQRKELEFMNSLGKYFRKKAHK